VIQNICFRDIEVANSNVKHDEYTDVLSKG